MSSLVDEKQLQTEPNPFWKSGWILSGEITPDSTKPLQLRMELKLNETNSGGVRTFVVEGDRRNLATLIDGVAQGTVRELGGEFKPSSDQFRMADAEALKFQAEAMLRGGFFEEAIQAAQASGAFGNNSADVRGIALLASICANRDKTTRYAHTFDMPVWMSCTYADLRTWTRKDIPEAFADANRVLDLLESYLDAVQKGSPPTPGYQVERLAALALLWSSAPLVSLSVPPAEQTEKFSAESLQLKKRLQELSNQIETLQQPDEKISAVLAVRALMLQIWAKDPDSARKGAESLVERYPASTHPESREKIHHGLLEGVEMNKKVFHDSKFESGFSVFFDSLEASPLPEDRILFLLAKFPKSKTDTERQLIATQLAELLEAVKKDRKGNRGLYGKGMGEIAHEVRGRYPALEAALASVDLEKIARDKAANAPAAAAPNKALWMNRQWHLNLDEDFCRKHPRIKIVGIEFWKDSVWALLSEDHGEMENSLYLAKVTPDTFETEIREIPALGNIRDLSNGKSLLATSRLLLIVGATGTASFDPVSETWRYFEIPKSVESIVAGDLIFTLGENEIRAIDPTTGKSETIVDTRSAGGKSPLDNPGLQLLNISAHKGELVVYSTHDSSEASQPDVFNPAEKTWRKLNESEMKSERTITGTNSKWVADLYAGKLILARQGSVTKLPLVVETTPKARVAVVPMEMPPGMVSPEVPAYTIVRFHTPGAMFPLLESSKGYVLMVPMPSPSLNGFWYLPKEQLQEALAGKFDTPRPVGDLAFKVAASGNTKAEKQLLAAAEYWDVDGAKRALADGANIHVRDEKGWTPLIHAAENGEVAMLEVLLEAGASVEMLSRNGNAPLAFAATSGNLDAIAVLLRAGARIDLIDKKGLTALMVVSANGLVEPTEYLLKEGADPNIQNERGETAMMKTAKNNSPKTLKLLIDYKANVNYREPKQGNTALIYASYNGLMENVKLLLAAGADPTVQARSNLGGTYDAAWIASEQNHPEVEEFVRNAARARNGGAK